MSESEDNKEKEEITELSASNVAEYLRGHPEFFNEFQELLQDIIIPHASGDAVSNR